MSATIHQAFTTSTLPGVSPLEPSETHQEATFGVDQVDADTIRFPWYEPERKRSARVQTSIFGSGIEPLRFHSGASAFWDFRGFTLAGAPVGITATAVSRPMRGRMLELVAQYASRGGWVFVDSGAFGAFVAGKTLDFANDVFPLYDELTAAGANARQLFLVMPDVVGNPSASMALQMKHRDRIAAWIRAGARSIFPLHNPEDRRFLEAIKEVSKGYRFGIGVPSNLAAWSPKQLERFCEREQPAHIHLLGMGSDARVRAMADLVGAISPNTEISCDSCTLLAHLGRGRRLTDRCVSRVEAAVEWILDDPSAETPFDDLSTYMVDVLWTPGHLSDDEIHGIAKHLCVDPEPLLRASKSEGLMEAIAHLDPDEQWLHYSLAWYVRENIYGPKLAAMLRGPIRAWEVARL